MGTPDDTQIASTVDEEERQQMREQLRAHQSRLHVLEIQAAKLGDSADPHISIEITEIQGEIARLQVRLVGATPAVLRDALLQTRQQALKAFYSQQWAQAEELLAQVLQSDVDDDDLQKKLREAERHLELQAAYQAICQLRDEGLWQAVLSALLDLAQQQADYPDSAGLRLWAEARQRREQHYQSALAAAGRHEWPAVVAELNALLAELPDDAEAKALLAQAQAAEPPPAASPAPAAQDAAPAAQAPAPAEQTLAPAALPTQLGKAPDKQALMAIFDRYKGQQGYWYDTDITPEVKAKITGRLELLQAGEEEILAYFVFTMWGGIGDGAAFTTHRLVWRNAPLFTPEGMSKQGALPYDKFPEANFAITDYRIISFGEGIGINHSGWCQLTSENILSLLNDIKALVAASPAPA